ncbi:MAG: selenium cofactor biosynthesis protein YqeC [Lacrimispora sp.]|uniref:selenium cofactor biosynthesis protein YqeC n=1 Tax=Lacrimispora sp. TaxID=2719234 RepID=UPI0039E32395
MELKWAYACEMRDGNPVMIQKNSLWEALGLHLPERQREAPLGGMVIAFVGGGGKTTSMFRLADELAEQGKRVIVTTSTKIRRPEDRLVAEAETAEAVNCFIKAHEELFPGGRGQVLVTGLSSPEGKFQGMNLSEMEKLADLADVLLVEADGAKMLPLKIPREGEPVLLKGTHAVIGCAGLDCLGQTWEEKCFRYELADKIFDREKGPVITPAHIARILTSDQGTRKGAEKLEYRILLNKADDEKRLSAGAEVLKALGEEWAGHCVITGYLRQ